MKISEKEDFVKANPHLEPIITCVPLIRGTATKPDAGFHEVLQNIKEKNSRGFYRSTVNTF